jgi:hypothetical protein
MPFLRRSLPLAALAAASLALAACGSDGDAATDAPTTAPITSAPATTAHQHDTSSDPTTATPTTAAPTTAAPTTTPAEAPKSIEVVANEFSFALNSDGRYQPGVLPVRLVNQGKEAHQVVVARLHQGTSVEQYVELAHTDEAAAAALVDYAGGVNAVGPGQTASAFAELAPGGHYVLLCFVPSADGVQHLHKGMVHEFTVTTDPVSVKAPETVAQVALKDFAIGLPAEGLAKPGTYAFKNEGAEPHEMIVLKLNEGKTFGDVVAFNSGEAAGPPPFTFAGGPGVVQPGGTMYANLALTPGHYVALCMIPGKQTHMPHAMSGMVAEFSI